MKATANPAAVGLATFFTGSVAGPVQPGTPWVMQLRLNALQNMIAYGTGTFEARDFIRTGFVIAAAASALLVVFALTYWPWMGTMGGAG